MSRLQIIRPESAIALSDEERARLQPALGGHARYSCCPACGCLSLSAVDRAAPNQVTVIEDHTMHCPRCAAAVANAPEIVMWVLSVIRHQENRRAPADEKRPPGLPAAKA